MCHVLQFSGENAERMKKTYGKFCGHHNEAVNNFKDLYSKDKRFQAFVKVRPAWTDIVDGKNMSFLHSGERFATELKFSSLFLEKNEQLPGEASWDFGMYLAGNTENHKVPSPFTKDTAVHQR